MIADLTIAPKPQEGKFGGHGAGAQRLNPFLSHTIAVEV
jgi:hypothetical protein